MKAGAPVGSRSMMAEVFTFGGANTAPGASGEGNSTVNGSSPSVMLKVGMG